MKTFDIMGHLNIKLITFNNEKAIKPIMYNNVVFLFKIDQIIKTIIIILFSYISSFQNGLTDLPIISGCHFMTIIIIVLIVHFTPKL